ncbi:hypothetical protein ACJMK2_000247 [Sinanodonta woodiana]|uniref:TGF-beta family profile domain-containing protein n=1 Tax=Sinanodonta woodiana TaxID=1069815 RepID=A0ABD3XS60_SINWO
MASARSLTWRFLLSLIFTINLYKVFCSELLVHKSLQNTMAEKQISKTAMERRMPDLQGLHQEPSPIENKIEESSARLFMLGLYDKTRSGYEDGSPGVDEISHLTFNSTLLTNIHEINSNDLIISFVNQEQPGFLREGMGYLFYFNFSEVEPDAILTTAELQVYKEPSKEQNVSMYMIQLFRKERGNGIDDIILLPEVNTTVSSQYAGWFSIDITNAAKYWTVNPAENFGMYMKVIDMNKGQDADSFKSGIVTDNGPENQQPFMVGRFTTTDEHQVLPTLSARNLQQVPQIAEEARVRKLAKSQKAVTACRRHEMHVDFSSVGWNSFIFVPAGYQAYYCAGACTYPLADHMNATVHAVIQSIVHSSNPEIPQPCCVPTKLSPIQLLYKDNNNNVVSKTYNDMIVEACGCL